jgi:hypothetical protein
VSDLARPVNAEDPPLKTQFVRLNAWKEPLKENA